MTSSITTATINSIDNTYPKSGQNNSTQGFRDNFTRIRENFQYAKDDIEALQDNVASLSIVDQNTSTTVSLLTHTTYFTIDVDPITVNLMAGTDGQEKVLCVADITASAISAGNISPITVTVSNAGWVTGGTVGNITLNSLGAGATVQFVNGRWVCSGNNNADFI